MLFQMADMNPQELPSDVAAALVERGPDLDGHDVMLLPRETRSGRTYYLDDDLDAFELARDEGLDAVFLHQGRDQRFLHENAAGWELQVAIAVSSSLTSSTILGIVQYLWRRARHAKEQGLFEGEDDATPIKLTIASVESNPATGLLNAKAVKMEGKLADVTKLTRELLEGGNE